MISQAARRPMGCLKTALRHSRQQKALLLRSMATETATPSSSSQLPDSTSTIPPPPPPTTGLPLSKLKFHTIKTNNPEKPIRTAFAVYPRVPSTRSTNPAALEAYHAQQIRRLDRTGARTALFSKTSKDSVRPGDVLQVSTNRGEPFAGVVMSVKRAGVDTAVLLRNHLTKVGVEMWFKIYSPSVTGIDIVWRKPRRARRARLYYLRKPKRDMGNVDHLVDAWRRSRNVFSSKGKGSATQGRPGKHAKLGKRR
ncbi:translation protein SH3-like domain-containing protein [Microdochium trichocladiopsis]|uniref:Translation protein SH3-like domain-containing protein n=1 Tax=Microdochium trichocladiopsis TaxID=1682393 RepID=A0A9P8YFG8_9PEZI|nr:translation protein SH3-like domain-containing protein [Microdochium trichocladiopsis]KAH7037937.1 translation protein SH3-like domain-containing protein [Microdochium trichocladiopsis]